MLEAALKAEMDVDEAGGPITVLVVEDNLSAFLLSKMRQRLLTKLSSFATVNQKVLKRQLSQRGFLPEVANNGQEALDILLKPEGKNIQVVLMDVSTLNAAFIPDSRADLVENSSRCPCWEGWKLSDSFANGRPRLARILFPSSLSLGMQEKSRSRHAWKEALVKLRSSHIGSLSLCSKSTVSSQNGEHPSQILTRR